MKKLFIPLFIVLFISISLNSLNAQWYQANNPLDVTVNCFLVDGMNIYAGTVHGLYLSTNNGISWTAVNTGLEDLWVTSLAVSGSNLYAGTTRGVFHSTNNGSNWIAGQNLPVSHITASGWKLFAARFDSVFFSVDYGKSWTAVKQPFPNFWVNALVIVGGELFAGTGGGGVFSSDDDGLSWTEVDRDLWNYFGGGNLDVGPFISNGSDLYALVNSDICFSSNEGTNWKVLGGLPGKDVTAFAVSGSNLIEGTWANGIFYSGDGGKTWTASTTGPTVTINDIALIGSYLFAGSFDQGLFCSTDEGVTWTNVNTVTDSKVNAIMVIPSDVVVSGVNDGLAVSYDEYGGNWEIANCGTSINAITSDNVGSVFAATNIGVLRFLNDSLVIFHVINIGLPGTVVNAITSYWRQDGTFTIFAGTWGSGVFMSTDKDTTWVPVNNGLPTSARVLSLVVIGNELFAGIWGNGVYLSIDNGTSWKSMNNGLTEPNVQALAVMGTDIFAGTSNGIFVSQNGGITWNPVINWGALEDIRALSVVGTNLFAGAFGQGIYYSSDFGRSWTNISSGLMNYNINALVSDGYFLFAATDAWVWMCRISQITGLGQTYTEVPKKYAISQNYPNPFSAKGGSASGGNPSTTINYSVPKTSLITIKVYDILGREIATLVSEQKPAGNYSVQFAVGSKQLASGIYFYRMQAGNFVETKKLILLK